MLGIYSVIAFSVASRVQEMAIRMALGSQRGAIVRLVLKSGAKLAVIGCVIGLGGAAAAAGLLRSLLFGVSPFDPLVLVGGGGGGVAAGAGRFRASGAAGRVHRSHARAASGVEIRRGRFGIRASILATSNRRKNGGTVGLNVLQSGHLFDVFRIAIALDLDV